MSVCLLLRFSVSVSPHVHVLVCLSLYSGLYLFCLQSGLWLVGQSVTVFPITRSSGNLVYIMTVLLSVFVYAYCTKLNSLIVVYSGFNTDYGSSEPLKTLVMLCYVKCSSVCSSYP